MHRLRALFSNGDLKAYVNDADVDSFMKTVLYDVDSSYDGVGLFEDDNVRTFKPWKAYVTIGSDVDPLRWECVYVKYVIVFTTIYTILRVNDFNNEYKLYFMSYVLLYKTWIFIKRGRVLPLCSGNWHGFK